MGPSEDDRSFFDPTGVLRSMREASIAAMMQMLHSEEYSRAMGVMLDTYLASSAPFRKLIETLMLEFVKSDAYAESMRVMLDTYLSTALPVRSLLAEAASTEAYTRATSAMLDAYLASSASFRQAVETAMRAVLTPSAARNEAANSFAGWLDPTGMLQGMRNVAVEAWTGNPPVAIFQQAIEQSMTQALMQLNMPTRTDVTSIGDRLGLLEQRMSDIERRLDAQAGAAPKPARPRKSS